MLSLFPQKSGFYQSLGDLTLYHLKKNKNTKSRSPQSWKACIKLPMLEYYITVWLKKYEFSMSPGRINSMKCSYLPCFNRNIKKDFCFAKICSWFWEDNFISKKTFKLWGLERLKMKAYWIGWKFLNDRNGILFTVGFLVPDIM